MTDHLKKKTTERGRNTRRNARAMSDPDRKFLQIVKTLDPQARLIETRRMTGGISAEMIAVKFSCGETTKEIVVRRHSEKSLTENPQLVEQEFEILKELCQAGLPVPYPYHLDATGRIFSRPYLVLSLLDGKTEYAPKDVNDFGKKIALKLLEIHSLNSDGKFSFVPDQKKRLDKELFRQKEKYDQSTDELNIREILKRKWKECIFNPPALLHGDFWPGNILWRDGEITGILDWEEAEIGDPLLELAITRFDLLFICGQECMDTFTRTYLENSKINSDRLPIFDLIAALRPSGKMEAWANAWRELGRDDITVESLVACHKTFRERAFSAT